MRGTVILILVAVALFIAGALWFETEYVWDGDWRCTITQSCRIVKESA